MLEVIHLTFFNHQHPQRTSLVDYFTIRKTSPEGTYVVVCSTQLSPIHLKSYYAE